MLGAIHHGHLFSWLARPAIAPHYNRLGIELFGFYTDIAVWSMVIAMQLSVFTRELSQPFARMARDLPELSTKQKRTRLKH